MHCKTKSLRKCLYRKYSDIVKNIELAHPPIISIPPKSKYIAIPKKIIQSVAKISKKLPIKPKVETFRNNRMNKPICTHIKSNSYYEKFNMKKNYTGTLSTNSQYRTPQLSPQNKVKKRTITFVAPKNIAKPKTVALPLRLTSKTIYEPGRATEPITCLTRTRTELGNLAEQYDGDQLKKLRTLHNLYAKTKCDSIKI